jgi:hypothetical protein
MFYGGRLLSHLDYNSDEVTDFIKLSKIHHKIGIIIDSDKRKKHQQLNKTKQRIKKSFEDNGCFVWITKGKEIENYISENIYAKTVKLIYGVKPLMSKWGQYNDISTFKDKSKIDKIKVAQKICENDAVFSVLDLEKKLIELVKYIKVANS